MDVYSMLFERIFEYSDFNIPFADEAFLLYYNRKS